MEISLTKYVHDPYAENGITESVEQVKPDAKVSAILIYSHKAQKQAKLHDLEIKI